MARAEDVMWGAYTRHQACIESINKILRNPNRTAEVQIADVEAFCWAMVELAFKIQWAVRLEKDQNRDRRGGSQIR